MTSLISPNVVQVVCQYLLAGEKAENVYHVHKASAWTQPEIDSLLTNFDSWETASASPLRSHQVSLIRLTGTDLTSLTSARVDRILDPPTDGGSLSDMLPPNVTFALKADIGERGKGRNGRSFWIGLTEADVDGSTVSPAKVVAIQGAMNALVTEISTGGIAGAELCIIHTRAGDAPISPATYSVVRTFVVTDPTVDSQRDRLPGHKRRKKKVVAPGP